MNLAAAAELLANDGDIAFPDVVEAARLDPDPESVALLAHALAKSGQMLGPYCSSADVASTGGPSSLSTLLCPLYLRHLGFVVPKLGVPGRPAGGVDVLALVPGYSTDLAPSEIDRAILDAGYAHFMGGDRFAPLDARLFAYRQQHGAQQVPALVAASLISKKLAVGLSRAGVEVRVGPHGNFGADWNEARLNTRFLVAAAEAAGVDVVCFLTDATVPFQPFIGRGEALTAVASLLRAEAGTWLRRHASECWKMALVTAGIRDAPEPDPEVLRPYVETNLIAQGASIDAFFDRADSVASEPRTTIVAPERGCWLPDLGELRTVILQHQRNSSEEFGDACGAVILAEPGSPVATGGAIASWRGLGDIGQVATVFNADPVCRTGRAPETVGGS